MYILNNVKISLDCKDYIMPITKKLNIHQKDLLSFKLKKKGLDCRNKKDIFFICNFIIEVNKKVENKIQKNKDIKPYTKYTFEVDKVTSKDKIIIVGSGPAGLFCAYTLVKAGLKPLIIERGEKVEDRLKTVQTLFKTGKLNTESNLQYGEGGAGTFSDGKLTTNINDKRIEFIKETFVEFGASDDILYLSKPHIGSDKLIDVVKNMRNKIISMGGSFLFNTCLIDLVMNNNNINGIKVNSNNKTEILPCDKLILACGHSSKDTISTLYKKGVSIEQKPFSMGVRIEHLQEDINKAQYGEIFYNHPSLPPAEYKLAVHLPNNRSLYTFCMCPGGIVVPSQNEHHTIVTNGMSYYKRDLTNANSALLVNVLPSDFNSPHPLAGLEFQSKYEKLAYSLTNCYKAPCSLLEDFMNNTVSHEFKKVKASYPPSIKFAKIQDCLPDFVSDTIRTGIVELGKKLKGFDNPDSVLIAIESRSSSPVRIVRNESFESTISNMYPIGEGSGYASGITTSALDGIKCAQTIINNYKKEAPQ